MVCFHQIDMLSTDYFTISNNNQADTHLAERVTQHNNNNNNRRNAVQQLRQQQQQQFVDKGKLEFAKWSNEINEMDQKTCPIKNCKLHSACRFQDHNFPGVAVLSFEDSALLAQNGYTDQPAIHSHISEADPEVLSNIRQNNNIIIEFREKL